MGMIDPLYVISGLIIGLLVGQTGVGGGSLMTPLLVLVFGFNPAIAVGTDLLYASATKTVGALVHGYNRTVDWQVVRRLATGSVPASLATLAIMALWNTAEHSSRAISVVLGVMLLLTAASLLYRRAFLNLVAPILAQVTQRGTTALTIGVGAILGVLVTFTSVGAGALGATALLLLYPRTRMAVIVGSDIAHAVPLTLVAGLGHLAMGAVNWPLLLSLLCGSVPGIILGSHMAARVPEHIVRWVMAAVLLVVGGRLVM